MHVTHHLDCSRVFQRPCRPGGQSQLCAQALLIAAVVWLQQTGSYKSWLAGCTDCSWILPMLQTTLMPGNRRRFRSVHIDLFLCAVQCDALWITRACVDNANFCNLLHDLAMSHSAFKLQRSSSWDSAERASTLHRRCWLMALAQRSERSLHNGQCYFA
jgi:hypothetical protein